MQRRLGRFGVMAFLFVAAVASPSALAGELAAKVDSIGKDLDRICTNLKINLGEKFDASFCSSLNADYAGLAGLMSQLEVRLNTIEARLAGVKASTGGNQSAPTGE